MSVVVPGPLARESARALAFGESSGSLAETVLMAMIDRSLKNGSPKHVAFVESLRKDPGTTPDVTRNVPTSSLKFYVR